MIFEKRVERKEKTTETAITKDGMANLAAFPLAMPLIAGPGAISATILLGSKMELHQLAFPWDYAVGFGGVPSFVSAINIHWSRCTRSFIREAHACGWRVNTYTVNDERTMRHCLDNGADGLITNHVTVGLAVLTRNSSKKVSEASSLVRS